MPVDRPFRHLYLHIPFCPRKCDYCAFVTHIGSLRLVEPYLDALCLELKIRADEYHGGPLDTVYFGGGTPSMLQPGQVARVLAAVDSLFGLTSGAEITLEAHPETVDPESLAGFKRVGITRVSFGAESLNAAELLALRRRHAPALVVQAAQWAMGTGFDSVALDLMYGLPGQSLSSWSISLRTAIDLDVQHLSLYPLAVEPKTTFGRKRREGRLEVPDDDLVCAMYDLACSELRAADFEHYEVANWARPGYQCRHNLSYWHNQEFLGAGVGAHGYLERTRMENIGQTGRYIERMNNGGDPCHRVEELTHDAEYLETVVLGLRLLQEGLSLTEVACRFEVDLATRFAAEIDCMERVGWVRRSAGRLYLAESAVPLANEVWSAFVLA